MSNRECVISLLREQIYYKNYKGNNGKRLVYFNKKTSLMKRELCDALMISKCTLLIAYIMDVLDTLPRTGHYSDMQLVSISYKSEDVLDIIGRNRNTYYKLINHLLEHGFLYKVKGSTFIVNPYYINNMTESHWVQMVNDIRVYDNHKLMKSFGSGKPVLPLVPQ